MGFAHLKKLLEDERVWCVAAHVAVHDGETSHFHVNSEGDLVVSCVTLIHGVPINANLDALAGGTNGEGVWHIPDPGSEVMISFDHGDFEGEAHIVSRTSGGKAPAGLGSGQIFILGTNVQIRSPGGTASKLPTFADLDNLRKHVDDQFSNLGGHVHATPSGPTTTITSAADGAALVSAPDNPAPTPVGTTVIEVE